MSPARCVWAQGKIIARVAHQSYLAGSNVQRNWIMEELCSDGYLQVLSGAMTKGE